PHQDGHEREKEGCHCVECNVVPQVKSGEAEVQRRARNIEQSILAARQPMQLHGGKPEDLAERDREKRIIDTATVGDCRADNCSRESRSKNRCTQSTDKTDDGKLLEQTKRIRAYSEI